jgi:hypothetical protein
VATVEIPLRKESSNHEILIFVLVRRVANTNFFAALPNALRKVTCVEKNSSVLPAMRLNR